MDKTININLGGTLFSIDEDAFRILRDYLQALNNRFANVQGGHETVEDIELRIAEIFQSQKGMAGVVTKENVESMIAIIGKPEDFDPGGPETDATVFTSHKKKLYRNPDDKIVGGVSSGIAAYLDTDPVLFRILFVLTTIFFGVGFFIYLGLWLALPEAHTVSQKRSMYGNAFPRQGTVTEAGNPAQGGVAINTSANYNNTSKLGNVVNEVFRALGRVFFIFLRVLAIIIGVSLVLTGFLFILCFAMIFVFKFPGIFSINETGINLVYLSDFLKYIVSPASVPWLMILTSIVVLLPMIALIYWGVKLIFWFKARDGVASLIALVVWVMACAALAIIGFNEGVSFAETGKSSVETILPQNQDTIYITTDRKIADLKYQKQISLPHEEYSVFLNEDKKELYIRPYLSVEPSEDSRTLLKVEKRSSGRNEFEAEKKTESFIYNYRFVKDSLNIDEYFTIPSGNKWSGDEIGLHLFIPAGTILKFDNTSRIMVHTRFHDENEDYLISRWESETGKWIMTADGLEPLSAVKPAKK